MKRHFWLVLLLGLLAEMLAAQGFDDAYSDVDVWPVLPECNDLELSRRARQQCTTQKLVEYVRARLDTMVVDRPVQGQTVVEFVVELDGAVQDVRLSRSLHPAIDSHLVHLFRSLKGFRPGLIDEMEVRCILSVPVQYRPTQAVETQNFTSFHELCCQRYRNVAVAQSTLRRLVETAPDTLIACTAQRRVAQLELTYIDPTGREEVLRNAHPAQLPGDAVRQRLRNAEAGARVILKLGLDVSGMALEIVHELFVVAD